MSKLRAVGMQEADIYKAVTLTPAKILGETDRGKLAVGALAELTRIEESPTKYKLFDTNATERYGKVWEAVEVFVQGKLVE